MRKDNTAVTAAKMTRVWFRSFVGKPETVAVRRQMRHR